MNFIEPTEAGFILLDAQRRLVSSNARFRQLYDLQAETLQAGTPLRQVLAGIRDAGRIVGVEAGDEAWLEAECQRHLGLPPAQRRQLGDGAWLGLSYTPTIDDGLLCYHQDISVQVDAESAGLRRRKLDALTCELLQSCNAADEFTAAVSNCLAVICREVGFDCGHVCIPSAQDPELLVSAHLCSLSDPARFQGFRQMLETTAFEPGRCLPGRVWQSAVVEAIDEIATDDDVLRAIEAGYCGLHAGLAWPLIADGQVIAVLEFYTEKTEPPPRDLLDLLQSVSASLGQVLESKRQMQSLELLSQAFAQNPAMVFITDLEGSIEYVNTALTETTGYDRVALNGKTPEIFLSGMMPVSVYNDIWRHVRCGEVWQGELHHRKLNGETFWSNTSLAPIRNNQGVIKHCIGIAAIVTEQKEAADRIEHLAFYDGLTGLPNMAFFVSQLKQQFARARRDDTRIALLLIDLDHFKQVNDSLGYTVGDELLQRVASRLQAALRECDLIARTGGDEFGVVIEIGDDSAVAADLARRTLEAIARRFQLDGQTLNIKASVGISTFPEDGKDVEDLIRHAQLAMDRGKQVAKGQYYFYAPKLDASIRDRKALEDELRGAVGAGQLRLWYQPQVDANTRLITGAEALIRWQHPQRGLVSPVDFIPMAEQSGLIIQIGAWALQNACNQLAQWQRLGLPEVDVAVNLSVVQFQHQDLIRTVREAIETSGIQPKSLTLEVTESVVMQKTEQNLGILQALQALGVQISLDDFGTGYSSLSYLTRFPVNKIKIDRSFVSEIFKDKVHLAIVDAVVKLGRVLGARVNVEGVETQAQFDMLLSRDIDEVQGFYFSKPVPAEEFGELLLLNQMAKRRDSVS